MVLLSILLNASGASKSDLMSMLIIAMIALFVLSLIVQVSLKSKFKRYGKVALPYGMTGKDVAEKMLRDHGITGVSILCTPGMLSDHYDPTKNTVNLSKDVYYGNSIAAAAVAAHECGHAVQHAEGYAPVRLRSALVPVVSFSSNIVMWVILIGIFLIKVFPGIMLFGIGLFALTTLFSFVTLPVEIDASRRAVNWLDNAGITTAETYPMACSALRTAAYTYVIAALTSLVTLFYYILIFIGRRD